MSLNFIYLIVSCILAMGVVARAQPTSDLTLVAEFETKSPRDRVCGFDKSSNIIFTHQTRCGTCKWFCKPSDYELVKYISGKFEVLSEYKEVNSQIVAPCAGFDGEFYALFGDTLVKTTDLAAVKLQNGDISTYDSISINNNSIVLLRANAEDWNFLQYQNNFKKASQMPTEKDSGFESGMPRFVPVDPVNLEGSIIWGGYVSYSDLRFTSLWISDKQSDNHWSKPKKFNSVPAVTRMFKINNRVIGVQTSPVEGVEGDFKIYEMPTKTKKSAKLIKTIRAAVYSWNFLSDGKSLFVSMDSSNNKQALYRINF